MARRRREEESTSEEESADEEEVTDEEASERSESESEAEESLERLTKADLQKLCRRLRLKPDGTKAELVQRITKHRKAEARARAGAPPAAGAGVNPDVKVWKEVFKPFVGRIKYPDTFVWHSGRVALCPPLWCINFWCTPPSDAEVFESGNEGPLVRNMKSRWRSLTGATEDELNTLAKHFASLFESITAAHLRVTQAVRSQEVIETWTMRNWELSISPVVNMTRLLQARKARSLGLAQVADKLEIRANLPLENFGADVAEMVERVVERNIVTPSAPLHRRNGSGGDGGATSFKCFKCKQRINFTGDRKTAIAAHRADKTKCK